MIALDERAQAEFRKVTILACLLFVTAPIAYLLVAHFKEIAVREGGEVDMMLYILLILAVFQPMISGLIAKVQIDGYKKQASKSMPAAQFYTTIFIMKAAMIEACFVYGLVVYFLGGGFSAMLYFYPTGILWSIIHWPRQYKMMSFLTKLQTQ